MNDNVSLLELAAQLRVGDLSEPVETCCLARAYQVNLHGIESQVAFLVEEVGEGAADKMIRDAAETTEAIAEINRQIHQIGLPNMMHTDNRPGRDESHAADCSSRVAGECTCGKADREIEEDAEFDEGFGKSADIARL